MKTIRSTSYLKKLQKNTRRYYVEKYKSYLAIFFSLNKKQREKKMRKYNMFTDKYWEEESNALLPQFYFRPKDIIILDLFAKKDILDVKKGVLKLYKKYYSHKFIIGTSFDNDIENILTGLDKVLSVGRSWYRTSIFDFENSAKLRKYIDCFEIEFFNVCSSYAAIKFNFHLSETFEKEIQCFAAKNYEDKNRGVVKIWKKNNKRSGAAVDIAVGGGDANESIKSRIIYEQMEYVKMLCMSKMNELFPLFSGISKRIYGINVFETNIHCDDSLPMEIYHSLGMNLQDGFLLSNAEKIFISTQTTYSENQYEADMMYVYNDQLVEKHDGFINAHDYIVDKFNFFLTDMGMPIIYKNLVLYYQEQIVAFRNKINQIQMKKSSYKKLLKLKYKFESIFYDFNIIKQQISIDNESVRLLQKLEQCDYAKHSCYLGRHPYKAFISIPQNLWHQIDENFSNLSNELNKKIEIAESFKGYNDIKKGYHLSWYQFIIAIVTLYLVIYPNAKNNIQELVVWISEKIMLVLEHFHSSF